MPYVRKAKPDQDTGSSSKSDNTIIDAPTSEMSAEGKLIVETILKRFDEIIAAKDKEISALKDKVENLECQLDRFK